MYNRLEKRYRQLDKVAPEFRTLAELDPLAARSLRGLFLEGEAELWPELFPEQLRVTRRQRKQIEQAIDLLREALDSAEDVKPETPGGEEAVLLQLSELLDTHTTITGE